MTPILEVWCLLEGRRLLEAGAYFNADTKKVQYLLQAALIRSPTLITANAFVIV